MWLYYNDVLLLYFILIIGFVIYVMSLSIINIQELNVWKLNTQDIIYPYALYIRFNTRRNNQALKLNKDENNMIA